MQVHLWLEFGTTHAGNAAAPAQQAFPLLLSCAHLSPLRRINTTGIYVPYYAGWGIYGSNLVIMSTEGSPELPFPDSRPHIPPASPAPRSPSPPGRGLSPPTHSLVPSPSPGNKQTDGQAAVPPVGGGTSKSVEGSLSQGAAVAIAVCVAVAAVAAAVGGLLWFLG